MKLHMSLRTPLAIILTVVITAFHGTAATAQAKPLLSVKEWVGKSPYFLWKTEPMHRRLTALLGAEYATFAANLDPATNLEDENGILHLEGNAPHQGGEEEAVLIIDIPNDTAIPSAPSPSINASLRSPPRLESASSTGPPRL